jgi:hypothetical protein
MFDSSARRVPGKNVGAVSTDAITDSAKLADVSAADSRVKSTRADALTLVGRVVSSNGRGCKFGCAATWSWYAEITT